jgi:hypothetical protein
MNFVHINKKLKKYADGSSSSASVEYADELISINLDQVVKFPKSTIYQNTIEIFYCYGTSEIFEYQSQEEMEIELSRLRHVASNLTYELAYPK